MPFNVNIRIMFIKYSHLLESDCNKVTNLIFIVSLLLVSRKWVSIFNYVMYRVRIGQHAILDCLFKPPPSAPRVDITCLKWWALVTLSLIASTEAVLIYRERGRPSEADRGSAQSCWSSPQWPSSPSHPSRHQGPPLL